MLPLLLKSLLGALAVLLIALLARSRHFYIAALVPLFPTFALIAHALVGSGRGAQALRTSALFGLCALVPYAIYLGVVAGLSLRQPLVTTLAAATVAWMAAAGVLLLAWNRLAS